MEEQYRDAADLNARVALHERFGANERPWRRSVFDRLDLPQEARILELGRGPGNLRKENLDRVQRGCYVTLTDASPGMVREAERNLGGRRDFRLLVADAREAPLESRGFDAVVANHVLYRAPDTDKAFSETARVLKPGGLLYAATNGQDHMRELGPMLRVLDPAHPADSLTSRPLSLGLEDGARQLSRWFSEVSPRRYEDALVVTEAEPLVDYVLSMTDARAAGRLSRNVFERRASEITASLEREVAPRGGIRITKETRLFAARL